jgi:hypothetical protein
MVLAELAGQYAVHFEARADRPSFLSFNKFRECRVEIA